MAAVTAPVPGLRTYRLESLSPEEHVRLMARPRVDFGSIMDTVRDVGRVAVVAAAPTQPGDPDTLTPPSLHSCLPPR